MEQHLRAGSPQSKVELLWQRWLLQQENCSKNTRVDCIDGAESHPHSKGDSSLENGE
jgi:hypothetical protein